MVFVFQKLKLLGELRAFKEDEYRKKGFAGIHRMYKKIKTNTRRLKRFPQLNR